MKVIVILLALAISGCATVGREITPNQLSDFKEGESTTSDVITKLGPPTTTTNSSQNTILIYSFVHTQARPESFIPLVGVFVGGADTRMSSVSFVFGKDGKLQHYSHTATKTGSAKGFSSGKYQNPDRSLPKEAP